MKRTYVLLGLTVFTLCVVGVIGCGSEDKDAGERTPASGTPEWLFRGGDIHRASMMKEWKSLDEDDRLAASSDLVTMQLQNSNQPLPNPAGMEALARSLEARLSEVSSDGSRDGDYVGDVVDEIWRSMQ